ncbi:MAG: hypothetical protein PVG32_19010, partial [Anaerolineales bacterium]
MKKPLSRIIVVLTITLFGLLLEGCSNTDSHPPATEVPQVEDQTAGEPTTTAKKPAPPAPTAGGTGSAARSLLTYNDLMNGFDYGSPMDEAALTLPEDAAPPEHIFEGRLELHGEDSTGEMTVLRGSPNVEPEESHLPEFDFKFVQHEGYIIPVQRGLIIAEHPYWNYILEPGRVWQENGDQGYSRAS